MQVPKQRELKITPAIKKEIARIVDERIREAHVTREDFPELKNIIKGIGEKVADLAEAQKRTENELYILVKEHQVTRKQLGGLSSAIGYGLEDKAYAVLPEMLKRDFGITVQEKLKRKYVKDTKGEYIEVNIVGVAEKDGKEMTIVGECKSQLSRKDIDEFIRKKLKRLDGEFKEIFPLVVTYMIT